MGGCVCVWVVRVWVVECVWVVTVSVLLIPAARREVDDLR